MFGRLRYLRGFVNWQKANSMMSRSDNKGAVKILIDIDLPEGDRQVALVQLASCYHRLNMKLKADKTYKEAMNSEEKWGLRRHLAESEYIMTYCAFYLHNMTGASFGKKKDSVDLYDKLLSLEVRDRMKMYLPLPNRSELRR